MRYRFITDKDNYVIGYIKDDNGVEFDDFEYLNCYRYEEGALILDAEKKEAKSSSYASLREIADLKKKLTDTDGIFAQELEEISGLSNPVTFIADFIKILASYSATYKDVIADRKKWRARIKELEG